MMLVWYAAYGSNLLAARFRTYLRGGPVPGSGREQHGARDPADPVADQAYELPRELVFAHRSRGWGGGGVCFVDPRPDAGAGTRGRAWLITVEQLSDVWAQENGHRVGPELDLDRVLAEGGAEFDRSGWYRRLEVVDQLDGHPVATFTAPEVPELNPAHPSYLAVMGGGLAEAWGLGAEEAARYLASRRGNDGHVDPDVLAEAIRDEGFGSPDTTT